MNQSNVILETIRRETQKTIIIASLVILVALGLLAFRANDLYLLLRGPVQLSPEQLVDIMSGVATASYVELNGDTALDTGLQEVSRGEDVTTYYHALVIGDFLILTTARQTSLKTQARGLFIPLPVELHDRVIGELARNHPEMQGQLMPLILDTTQLSGAYIGLLTSLGFVLPSALFIIVSMRYRQNPYRHPIMRDLRRFGSLDTIIEHLNCELALPHDTVNNLHFTQSWIVYAGWTKFGAMRRQDVMWLYKMADEDTCAVFVWDRYGQQFKVNASKKHLDTLLHGIHSRAPWAIASYSDEIQKQWKKNRANFINAVDNERRMVLDNEQ
jgi:hypothetical protein